jgi:hypothetical protein
VFRGTYRKKLGNGTFNVYSALDTVLFQGNLYEAKKPTYLSPIENQSAWEYKGLSEIYNSANPPLDPQVGQIWTTNGKFYTYFYDGNNYAWVEI